MAICQLSVKAIGRAQGPSATAAAAYRAVTRIEDERTGLLHDYSRKGDVLHREIVAPDIERSVVELAACLPGVRCSLWAPQPFKVERAARHVR
jgi:hypothetical protein